MGQIDGGAALRTGDHLDLPLTQLVDLFRRQRADEILFEQEINKRDQAAVSARAAEVFELRRVLLIVRLEKTEAAPRTRRCRRGGLGHHSGLRLLRDDLKYLQSRSGRQPQIFARIEPEDLTRAADINRHWRTEVSVERHRLHFRGALRAGHPLSIMP